MTQNTTTTTTQQHRIAPIHLHLINSGGSIVLNAWDFSGVINFGNVGSMLYWHFFDEPLYVREEPMKVLDLVSQATGLDFGNVLELIRNDRGYMGGIYGQIGATQQRGAA